MTAGPELRQVPLGEITVGPNYRRDVGDVGELVESIRLHGILHPVIARPAAGGVELVVGQRRHAAAARLGLETIPVLVREISDAQVLDLQVAENLNRQDVTPLDEAEAFGALVDRGDCYEEIAARFGRPAHFVAQRVLLRDLSGTGKEWLADGHLPLRHAAALAQLAHRDQDEILRTTYAHVGSLQRFRQRLEHYQRLLSEAPFDRLDLTLNPGAGICSECPWRTRAQPDLFADEGSAADERDRCLRPTCWDAKVDAHVARAVVKLAGDGRELPRLKHASAVAGRVHTWQGAHHVGISDTVQVDGTAKSWSKVLPPKKRPPPDAVVVENGKVVPAWKPATLAAAAKAHGISVSTSSTSGSRESAGQKKFRQESRRWNEVADRMFGDLPARLETRIGSLPDAFGRMLAGCALLRCTNDAAKAAGRRRKLERRKNPGAHVPPESWRETLGRHVHDLDGTKATALALEVLAPGYGVQGEFRDELQVLAEFVGFDAAAEHRQVIEAERAVAKARAKKATKKKPAKGAGPDAAAAAAPPAKKKPRKKARKSAWAGLTDEEKKDRVRKLVAGGPRARAAGQEGGAA